MTHQEDKKYVIVVEFEIYQTYYDDFLLSVKKNAGDSLKNESGCLKFDVLESLDTWGNILLYEIYTDQDAFSVHLNQPHYKDFSQSVEKMVKSKAVKSYFIGG